MYSRAPSRVQLEAPWRDGLSRAGKLLASISARLPSSFNDKNKQDYCKMLLDLLKVAVGPRDLSQHVPGAPVAPVPSGAVVVAQQRLAAAGGLPRPGASMSASMATEADPEATASEGLSNGADDLMAQLYGGGIAGPAEDSGDEETEDEEADDGEEQGGVLVDMLGQGGDLNYGLVNDPGFGLGADGMGMGMDMAMPGLVDGADDDDEEEEDDMGDDQSTGGEDDVVGVNL